MKWDKPPKDFPSFEEFMKDPEKFMKEIVKDPKKLAEALEGIQNTQEDVNKMAVEISGAILRANKNAQINETCFQLSEYDLKTAIVGCAKALGTLLAHVPEFDDQIDECCTVMSNTLKLTHNQARETDLLTPIRKFNDNSNKDNTEH